MGCTECGTSSSLPKGCKNNGSCGSSGCNEKLSVFDWLSNMSQPIDDLYCPFVEIRFKNERKEFYINVNKLPFQAGDIVVVESSPGHDIGVVSLVGTLVNTQMRQRKISSETVTAKIYRKANQKDIEVWQSFRDREQQIMLDARRISKEIGLEMKISDVEFQGDGLKATFYYTSESRVDFRQLIRDFSSAFKCRIEMRQIGYRQEAAKIGGIGSCGRELCCSTWLTDFRSVSTSAARYQQLSINPHKIAGQCGKLKCCLNYELDSYMDAMNDFPKTDTWIKTAKGVANCVKIDVFKREMWFAYQKSENFTWYKFTVQQVKKFITQNKKGENISSLEELNSIYNESGVSCSKDVIKDNSIERFENKKSRKRNNKRINNLNNKIQSIKPKKPKNKNGK